MLFRLDTARIAALLRQAGILPGPPRFAVLIYTTEGSQMAEITVFDTSAPLDATVTFLDAKGAETSPDDTPAWSSSDETVATVTASDDGRSATVTIGTPGATVIEVTSTDTDGTEVVAQGTVTVQPGEAVIGNVAFAEAPTAKVSNADFAIRKIAEKAGAGQYVAVPARSWVPRTVTIETQTSVKFEYPHLAKEASA